MCTKESMLVKYVKFFAYYIIKMNVKIVKKIMKMTLREFLSVCVFIFLMVLVWTGTLSDLSGEKNSSKNPVLLWWTSGFIDMSSTRYCHNNIKCDVYSDKSLDKLYNIDAYLFYGSSIHFNDLPLPRKPEKIIWGLYHEESPRNVEELLHEPVLSLFNFSSTMSRHSNVPFPLQYLESLEDIISTKYFIETSKKNEYLKEIAPILYLQSDCETSTERDKYVKELMNYVKVDSYGACLKNKDMPKKFVNDYLNNLNDDDFLNFVAKYKFVIAIENGVCEDYITEKFWRAIKVGSVPIYFGSPSIRDWLPNNKSAILLDDFTTTKILHEHINKLLANDSFYEEYLKHKTEKTISNERLIEELRQRPYQNDTLKTIEKFECFICQKIHERIEGKLETNIVNKSHYNCPKPVSALLLEVNPSNSWVYSWDTAKKEAERIYQKILNNK